MSKKLFNSVSHRIEQVGREMVDEAMRPFFHSYHVAQFGRDWKIVRVGRARQRERQFSVTTTLSRQTVCVLRCRVNHVHNPLP